MPLRFILPHHELRSFIEKIWLYESAQSSITGRSLIAPNGKPKIIIPFRNEISTTGQGKTTVCRENDICFIGIRDVPVTLSTPETETGSIGVELTTAGAYRFLNVPFHELTNNLFSFTDLYAAGNELRQRMMETEKPDDKITLIQRFLLARLREGRNNPLVQYTVDLITTSDGLIEIRQLEKKTGYSKRYLDMLFRDHLGVSPKTLATIVRFQRFYKSWAGSGLSDEARMNLYDLYYDESHFIKEFKRYTGYTPSRFSSLSNDFGRHF